MSQIIRTMSFFLTHSIITLLTILLLAAVLLPIQLIIPFNSQSPEKSISALLMINTVLSSFVGIYFGGGMLKLKQIYLWSVNEKYRKTLVIAFLLPILTMSILQAWSMSFQLNDYFPLLLIPFCIAVFSAQLVLGIGILQKIFIPMVPLLLAQLYWLGKGISIPSTLLFAATLVLIFYMFRQGLYKTRNADNAIVSLEQIENSTNLPIVQKYNYYIAIIILRALSRSKRDVSWAVSLPQTKIPLTPILFSVLMLFIYFLGDRSSTSMFAVFTTMFLTSIIFSIVKESRDLLRQTKTIAHVFSGENHEQLRKMIINSVDKNIVLNSLTLYLLIIASTLSFGIDISTEHLTLLTLSIITIGFSIYPVLLCMKWVNVSLALVISICVFGALAFVVLRWLSAHSTSDLASVEAIVFISLLATLRFATTKFFMKYPIEKLLKNQ